MPDSDTVHLVWAIPAAVVVLVALPFFWAAVQLTCRCYTNEEVYTHG